MTTDGLSPQTEEILRRAQQGGRMPAMHKRRLKGAILARIAVASTATLAAGQGAATAMGLGFVAKTMVGLALVGSLGAGSYLALRPAHHAPAARVAAAPALAAPSPVLFAPPVVAPPVTVAAPSLEKAPLAHARRPVARHVAPEETSNLAVETTLLRDADRALRAGDTVTALARLDEHAARFPRGALAPERAGERLVVLCQVGVADARAVSQFLAEHAGSPLAARVRRACAPTP